ncbi:MAG TPA: flagellar biosynthesis protein FlhF [Cerasibacillus sp.]|uniref:flagellar biosynthesis protein FlhF n=1 Tax=Cerasibacillus sp. TaxID=2498711 RepID=UPI002F402C04
MKLKRFVVKNMPEAIQLIRKELGPDAVILQSKEVKQGGFLGLFKKRKLEVIAGRDPNPIQHGINSQKATQKIPIKQTRLVENHILEEIRQLKNYVQDQTQTQSVIFPDQYQAVYEYLIYQEMDHNHAERMIKAVMEKHQFKQKEITRHIVGEDTLNEIENQLFHYVGEGITYDKKIVHFVGPTGVGKTTTLAKVAAKSILQHKKRVAFITTDTYRIAAVEQLKTYAKILDAPLEVAYSVEDYKKALEKFMIYDLILVDTAGRNFREDKYMNEVKNRINFHQDIDIYLVLSLTAKPNDLRYIGEQFADIPIKELIFTKLDETRQYGSMISFAIRHEKKIAYITNGQAVPDDIMVPTSRQMSELIMEDYLNA